MKNFRVTDGDLDVSSARRVNMVQGRDKLIQDLTLWLLEPLGVGFMTPAFGSTLNTTVARDDVGRRAGRFIGQDFNERIASEVEAEIDRVLNLYQQNQILRIRQAQVDGELYLWNRREILNSIDDIKIAVDRDRAIVQVALTTGANQELTFLAEVDGEETSIAAQG